MGRSKTYDRNALVVASMERFWQFGYYGTSISDLVAATGVSRFGLYAEFHDKRSLFLVAVESYVARIVTPAFAPVESRDSGLVAVRGYFETHIALAVQNGLPGMGCLLANTMVECGPHDVDFGRCVQKHLERLQTGFRNAIENDLHRSKLALHVDATQWANLLTIAAQGLWSFSRVTQTPQVLIDYVNQLLSPLEEAILA